MIRSDQQLALVQRQLDRAESALASLRRDVLDKNAERYRLMSQSYVEMILSLRAEIDEYLGINTLTKRTRRSA